MRLAALALLCAAAPAFAADGAPARRPLIVVVALDTLRADRLGCYGYAGPTSPGLDRLASEGVLFERAISQASWTLPSFASLFTSREVVDHGLWDPQGSLRPLDRSFVQALREGGYRTGAFVDGPFFDRRYGFDRGFERYDVANGYPVETFLSSALRWLDEESERPTFLFFHTTTVHAPYRAVPPYRHRSDPEYAGPVDRLVLDNYFLSVYNREWSPHWGPKPVPDYVRLVDSIRASPADRAHIASHYDDGIARADGALEELWSYLKRRGLYEDAVIIVLSDHGEELGERGKFRHNHSVLDVVVRVPLIVKLPRAAAAGRRVARQVRLVDVGPTALALAGFTPPTDVAGMDLSPLLAGGTVAELPDIAFTASDAPGGRLGLFSARTADWKLVRATRPRAQTLYDLVRDPGETRDVSKDHPREAARLASALDQWLEATRKEAPKSPLAEKLKEALRAAGYHDGP